MNQSIKKAIAETYEKGLCDFGVRAMTNGVTVEVGQAIDYSYIWEDNIATDEQMDGVSTVGFGVDLGEPEDDELEEAIKTVNQNYNSAGQLQVVIVAGNHNTGEVHNDHGERILSEALCVAIIQP